MATAGSDLPERDAIDVSLQERDVGAITQTLAVATFGVGRGAFLHRDQVIFSYDWDRCAAHHDSLCALDHLVEHRIERELHGFAARVAKVDAVSEDTRAREAGLEQHALEPGTIGGRYDGDVRIERRPRNARMYSDRDAADEGVRYTRALQGTRHRGSAATLSAASTIGSPRYGRKGRSRRASRDV
jgi:hypothetical protein